MQLALTCQEVLLAHAMLDIQAMALRAQMTMSVHFKHIIAILMLPAQITPEISLARAVLGFLEMAHHVWTMMNAC